MDKNVLLGKCKAVICQHFVDCEFDSHDFIMKFLAMFEEDYKILFANSSIQHADAQLARFLSLNAEELGIRKLEGLSESENFHGEKSSVHKWSSKQ